MKIAIFLADIRIIVTKIFVASIIRGIYQDAMFDTKGKAFSGAKIPKKA